MTLKEFMFTDGYFIFLKCLHVNSLAPGRYGYYHRLVIFKLNSRIDTLSIAYEIVLRWLPQDPTDD